jgi:hypothetical protein
MKYTGPRRSSVLFSCEVLYEVSHKVFYEAIYANSTYECDLGFRIEFLMRLVCRDIVQEEFCKTH